ncbi:DEAD/DEAH box helicase [Tateyamaria sp. SN6-1]|uniref:DEAD/DEAH box helicase n=1 Tax=Tateyamaria sp. SN6-1 TaxID=3092148 RepID=UPI0039F4A5EB
MGSNVVIDALASLGIAQLAAFWGESRLEGLSELGVSTRPRAIAEAMIAESGLAIFRNRKLRNAVLKVFPQQVFRDKLGTNPDGSPVAVPSNFSWGRNDATIKFLKLIDVNIEDAFPSDLLTGPKPYLQTEIAKPLFDYQNSIRKQLVSFSFLEARQETNPGAANRRIVAHMPTGSGKTRTAMEFICDFLRFSCSDENPVVVWLAHSEELCEQAIQTFLSIWSKLGSENANVYSMWGGRKPGDIDLSKPCFIVTSFQSCYSSIHTGKNTDFDRFAEIRRECSLLIVDEAHMSMAPTYKKAIEFLCNSRTTLIGLTATPGRHHVGGDTAQTKALADFYGGKKLTIDQELTGERNSIEYLQERGILSTVDRMRLNTNATISLDEDAVKLISELLDIPSNVLAELGSNAQRTLEVVAAVEKLALVDKKQTIVFCPSKQNASDMALVLRERGCSSRAVTGETPPSDRREAINDFKNGNVSVLTNFGVLTTGFDAPKTEAVVIARPTTSVVLYSQMVGRGLRGHAVGGTSSCTVVDVVDNIINLPSVSQAFTYFDEHFGGE